ncbi:hypothetical protein QLX08_003423 [Tetragonisca angustula]|uniref:Closca n=1 Tax=Tetragonisca angustula TaxID=166442 RepID=A0AAW1A709_9HYME
MISKLLLILILIDIANCDKYIKKNRALNSALKDTADFFGRLKSDYASKGLNNDKLTDINTKVAEYIKNTSRTISSRRKRELRENPVKGVSVLNGFHDVNEFSFVDARDVSFFSLQYGLETVWFAAVLDVSRVSLHRIKNGVLHNVDYHPVRNGQQMMVNSCPYQALLIIQHQDGFLILSFSEVQDSLRLVQSLELDGISHLAIWNGMSLLHLATASSSNVSIYTWLGDYFDSMQVINVGTEKLIPFQSKGFMYLAVTGPSTLIFKYSMRSNKFVVVQKLPSSRDVSYFQLAEGHFMEHYLTLSTETSAVVYKEIRSRFVPFQRISAGEFVVPIISRRAIVLLTLRNSTVVSYQYNGWRFIELDAKLPGISQFRQVTLYDKELLLMRSINNNWTLKQPLWIGEKSYKNLQEEIRLWNIDTKDRIQKAMKEIPKSRDSVKILRGHIDQLRTHNINGQNSQQLKDAYKQYKKLISKFQAQKVAIRNKLRPKNMTISSLHGKTVQVKCKQKCKVNRLNVTGYVSRLPLLIMSMKMNRTLGPGELNIKKLKNWRCPVLSLPIEEVTVSGSINGITLKYLQENALKVTGDQEVSGKHSFDAVKAANVSMPLNIATYLTNQDVVIEKIKVKQLTLTTGGILLPLNGSFSTITGSIKTPKLKIKNLVDLKGKIEGKWKPRLSRTIFINEPMTLNNNISLENVKIDNLISTNLIASKTGSIKSTLSNAISLQDNVPVSLILSNEKMKWSNITLHGFQRWVTANFHNVSVISGKKHFLQNVEITKSSYDTVKFSKNQNSFLNDLKLCATSVIAPEVRTSLLTADIITAKKLNSPRIFGKVNDDYFIDDSTIVSKPVLSGKFYYRNFTAKDVFTTQLGNLNLTELKNLVNLWAVPNILNTSIEAKVLRANTLRSPVTFYIELPKIIRNVVLEQNVHVDYINNIDVINFLDNAIKLDDMKSLQNITFRNGFSTNRIYASDLPFHLIDTEKDLNLHKKRISGDIETSAINLPYSFKITENETPVDVFIKGSARFSLEPTITNVNDIALEKLLSEVWLTTNTTTLSGTNLHFKNIVINGNVTLNNMMSTLNVETWRDISKRVLSKTKSQEISHPAFLGDVEVPFIMGSNVSRLKSSVPDLNDVFENSLLKNKDQRVKAKWTFDTLKITGNLNGMRTINKLDLKKDVMRHDSRENTVVGKKTIMRLFAENLNGYNFDKWAANALTKSRKHVNIEGRKTFSTATFNDVKVSGTVMGNIIEEALTKSTNQTIYGQKRIQGSINASELIVNGLINDVNLTQLIDQQLKKNKPLQTIRTRTVFQNSLHVRGNLTVRGTYDAAEMKNFYTSYSNVLPVAERMERSLEAAEEIRTALQNRAVYISKLEVIKDTVGALNESATVQTVQCKLANFSSRCINNSALNTTQLTQQTNNSNFILLKSIVMDEEEFIVLVKFDSVSIFSFNEFSFNRVKSDLVHSKELYIPRIMEAFVQSRTHALWIVLRLDTQTLVLRYQPWDDLQEYVLPATDVFEMIVSPNDQLLLLLSDGVWDLEGLSSPRNIIEIPFKEKVETFVDGHNFYIKCTSKNNTTLMKARYIRN